MTAITNFHTSHGRIQATAFWSDPRTQDFLMNGNYFILIANSREGRTTASTKTPIFLEAVMPDALHEKETTGTTSLEEGIASPGGDSPTSAYTLVTGPVKLHDLCSSRPLEFDLQPKLTPGLFLGLQLRLREGLGDENPHLVRLVSTTNLRKAAGG